MRVKITVFIIDYAGIMHELEEAMETYTTDED